MQGTQLVGLCAGLLTTAANVPQVLKTWRERSGDGLSRRMLLTLSAGLAVWVWYGFLQHDLPIIVTNLLALLLSTTLLILKRRFGTRSHAERKLAA
jgi:MtN3 and saliva related transmembrane protein